jgi:hypothetical protein
MGWQDYHLHRFEIEGESYSVISREADMLGDDFIDEKKVRLNRVIPGGYVHILRAFRNPKHPDHEDIMNWLEEGYDPERFNVHEVNERLIKIR